MTTNDLTLAVRQALAAQSREVSGFGVGLEFPVGASTPFVQWCREPDGALYLVEVLPPTDRPEATASLTGRGFAPHARKKLAKLGIWAYERPDPLEGARTDAEVEAVITALVQELWPVVDGPFRTYP